MTEMPVQPSSPQREPRQPREGARKVGLPLAIGIFLLPIVFAWFLVRKGHSVASRIIGFVWLALVLLVWIGSANAPPVADEQAVGATAAPAEQTAAEKAAAAEEEATRLRAETERNVRRSPENYLTIEEVDGIKGGFETVLILSGRIRNTSDMILKDPTFRCDLFGSSGTKVGTVRETLFEQIPAQGTKRFRELNMGFMGSTQVANFNCLITDAEVVG